MGRLKTIRPPALGGEPEIGRSHFERAIELSGGNNLAAKVEFARSYARLIYDRELHDRLLHEVLRGDVRAEGYTLLNVMAQNEARELLAKLGYDPEMGARPLKRVIQSKVEDALSDALLTGEFQDGDTVLIDAADDELFLTHGTPEQEEAVAAG